MYLALIQTHTAWKYFLNDLVRIFIPSGPQVRAGHRGITRLEFNGKTDL